MALLNLASVMAFDLYHIFMLSPLINIRKSSSYYWHDMDSQLVPACDIIFDKNLENQRLFFQVDGEKAFTVSVRNCNHMLSKKHNVKTRGKENACAWKLS